MRRWVQVEDEVRAAALARGHVLGEFDVEVVAAGTGERGWEARCTRCGRTASAWTRNYKVRGEAVATRCTGAP